jgi:hypothetical protein
VVPGCDGAGVGRERRGNESHRRSELDERDIGGNAMAQHGVHVEIGVPRHGGEVLEHGLSRTVELDQLVPGARQHAMRGREREIARERDTRAERAV